VLVGPMPSRALAQAASSATGALSAMLEAAAFSRAVLGSAERS
jgi:hypothetical protein